MEDAAKKDGKGKKQPWEDEENIWVLSWTIRRFTKAITNKYK